MARAEEDPVLGRVIIGRSRVERALGEGASGRVYAATQLSLGNTVALKMLQPQHAASKHHVRRFYREARAATRLTSQHIVRVLDFGVDDATGAPFIVMELLSGETLSAWLARVGPLTPRHAARVMAQVARALIDAAQAGIVHRDLKPDNIMHSETGDGMELLKVADFGVAKDLLADDGTALTAAGVAIGTPAYMAPEQVSGGAVDHRSDLYALGCILYELVSGRRPFEGLGRAELMSAHLLTPPPPLPEPLPSGESAPPTLSELIERLLAKSPAERPPDARAVIAALDAIAAGREAELPRTAPRARQRTQAEAAPVPAIVTAPRALSAPKRVAALTNLARSKRRKKELTPKERDKLERKSEGKRRRWRRHRRVFAAVSGGLFGLNVVTSILDGHFEPWSLIIMAVWGPFLWLHWVGYRTWREENEPLLGDDEEEPSALLAAEAPPRRAGGGSATSQLPASTWPALLERCRRAVEGAERALREVDTEAGGGTSSREKLRAGLQDVERLSKGAMRLEVALAEVSPDLEALRRELADLDAQLAGDPEARLRAIYESNRALLVARRQRLEQLEGELVRMRATVQGFALAAENIRLDAARIGGPRLSEYALDLQEPLRRLDDEIDVLDSVEDALASLEADLTL
jgi:serine/threonine protein kinase